MEGEDPKKDLKMKAYYTYIHTTFKKKKINKDNIYEMIDNLDIVYGQMIKRLIFEDGIDHTGVSLSKNVSLLQDIVKFRKLHVMIEMSSLAVHVTKERF